MATASQDSQYEYELSDSWFLNSMDCDDDECDRDSKRQTLENAPARETAISTTTTTTATATATATATTSTSTSSTSTATDSNAAAINIKNR